MRALHLETVFLSFLHTLMAFGASWAAQTATQSETDQFPSHLCENVRDCPHLNHTNVLSTLLGGDPVLEQDRSRFLSPENVNQQNNVVYNNRLIIEYANECYNTRNVPAKEGDKKKSQNDDDDNKDNLNSPIPELPPTDKVRGRRLSQGRYIEHIVSSLGEYEKVANSAFGSVRHNLLGDISDTVRNINMDSSVNTTTIPRNLSSEKNKNIPNMSCKLLDSIAIDICQVENLSELPKSSQKHGKMNSTSPGDYRLSDIIKNELKSKTKSEMGEDNIQTPTGIYCVESIIDDEIRDPFVSTPNDPLFTYQWHLQDKKYSLDAVHSWNILKYENNYDNGNDTVVSVIDTGCAWHEDLYQDPSTNAFWFNSGETNCNDGIDNDDNGYVDDCKGWNFFDGRPADSNDNVGHGTLVASVVAALSNNGLGIAGLHLGAKVMCLKAGDAAGIWLSNTLEAMSYSLRMGVTVINASYGLRSFNRIEYKAIDSLRSQGVLVVTSAGNYGCNIDDPDIDCAVSPGAYNLPNILNVGSSDTGGGPSSFSCWGKESVDVFAPGSLIVTAMPFDKSNAPCNNCYALASGTSFAAPLVAGIGSAIWNNFRIRNPPGWATLRNTIPEYQLVKDAIIYGSTGSMDLIGKNVVNGIAHFTKALTYYDKGVPPTFTEHFFDPPIGRGWRNRGCNLLVLTGTMVTMASGYLW